MNISGIAKSSLIDFPGIISCVLFVPGCNYSCFYCHNRELIDGSHILLTPQYIMDFLKKRTGLLDGVVISGGEPTLQNDMLSFLAMLKELGYQVKLDTNGSHPHRIKEILQSGLCDYFAVDYKAPASHYQSVCGCDTDAGKVIESIELLLESNIPFEVRTTVIPELWRDELITMVKEIPPVPRYVLNRYKVPEKYMPEDEFRIQLKPHSAEDLHFLAAQVSPYQPNVVF